MDFIKKKEWVRYKSYWDFKQWSICYGMKSTKWATATKEQCDEDLKNRVKYELDRINKYGEHLEDEKKIALISFFYNVWYKHNILLYASKGDYKSTTYIMNKYVYVWWKINKGLQYRRQQEILLFNNEQWIQLN